MVYSFSSSHNWSYDVFPSFSGEDVRVTFLSHFLKELDRKLIIAFKDNEIERSESLYPMLKQAIKTSRIAVVVFSEIYSSSSWCLNELVEILKCRKEYGQKVIPVFYGLDPSHVRKQIGNFGEAFVKTCQEKTEEETKLWRQSLTNVANIRGYHSQNWPNEAIMIEAIANDVLGKLNLTPPKAFEGFEDFEDFVGMEYHIAKMSVLLNLESKEVRMVGIWGSSGIGKTSIARVLYSHLSRQFQSCVFIDSAFVIKSMEIYKKANADDYNMKMHLVRRFLSKILDKKEIKIDSLGAVAGRLKHQKVLIFIDDLDAQMVLETLVGQTNWFGCGSRIIVITKDKHFLRAHGIDHIYEVGFPSNELALKMFCRYAFKQFFPPDGLREFASEVLLCAGNLPLGLKVLGRSLKGRDKEDLMDMLPRLRSDLDGDIDKTLRVSYNGLNSEKDKVIFRHIACLFNGEKLKNIKLLLEESRLDVNIGLKNLIDKSLIHVRDGIVEMHSLLQEVGKKIVRTESNEPGEREFLTDAKDICDLLEDNTGTKKVLGIALDMDEIDELHIHENAFKGMRNLLFLKLYTKEWYHNRLTTKKYNEEKDVRWHLPENFDYLSHKLRLLRLDRYPRKCLPSSFRPENLIKLQMHGSKLERLWEGVQTLNGLKEIDLKKSIYLREIPDLSMATNLEKLYLSDCSCLVELPSSIQYLNKLEDLIMSRCSSLEILPNGINLQSLGRLELEECSRLNMFPDISTNISELFLSGTRIETLPSNMRLKNLFLLSISLDKLKSEKLWGRVQPLTPFMTMLPHSLTQLFFYRIPSLVELPSEFQNFTQLRRLGLRECINLETLPTSINIPSLDELDFTGSSGLQTFPNISTSIHHLYLSGTGIEEVSWWIENFSNLERLWMKGCNKLQCVSLHISKLKHLSRIDFSKCKAPSKARWNDCSNVMEMATDNIHSKFLDDESSSSFPDNFINLFNFNADLEPIDFPHYGYKRLRFSGEKVLSYFTHQTTSMHLTNIPILQTSLSQPFFRFKACVVVHSSKSFREDFFEFDIHVSCRFKDKLDNHFDSRHRPYKFYKRKGNQAVIFECCFPLNKENASLGKVKNGHVDIQLHLTNSSYSTSKVKEWGIRLSDDFSPQEIQLGNDNNLPDVCETDEDNIVNETDRSEESEDNNEETERSNKRIKLSEEDEEMSL